MPGPIVDSRLVQASVLTSSEEPTRPSLDRFSYTVCTRTERTNKRVEGWARSKRAAEETNLLMTEGQKAGTGQKRSKAGTGQKKSKAGTGQKTSKAGTGQKTSKADTGQKTSKADTGQKTSKAGRQATW
eukprot:365911-Chlamydomonas_euryale.AAC.1